MEYSLVTPSPPTVKPDMASVACHLARVLVAAAALSCGLPVWQHSHPGGDQPHHHDTAHHHAAHDHAASHRHSSDGLALPCAHLHVCLFGFDITVPLDSDDRGSEIGQAVFLTGDAPPAEVQHTRAHFMEWPQPDLSVSEPAPLAVEFRVKSSLVAPLSDTARHERSGVQLI